MIRYIISLCFISASIFLCHSKDEIRWLNTVYDFGAFSEDDHEVQAAFRFVNEGSEPVSIVSASATCGCTKPTYDMAPIAINDTATIQVSYNPVGRPGRFEKYVYVRTTASPDREKLTIKGAVIGSASTVSKRYPVDMGQLKLRNGVAMLGRIPAGSSKSESIDGYNASNDSLEIVFSNLPSYLNVVCAPEIVPPGELVNINFFFSGRICNQWGIISDSIGVSTDKGVTVHHLPVVAIVEEDFSKLTPEELANSPSLALSSDRIELPDIPKGSDKPVQGSLTLTNHGKSPLVIHRVYSQDKAVSWDLPTDKIGKGKSATLTVTYDPTGVDSKIIDTRLTLIVNDPASPTRTVRIVALRP